MQVSGKRKGRGVERLGFIAMGMNTGTVTVWDLQRGVVAFKLGKGLELPPVTDVAFSADGRTLFSASLDKDVLEWGLEVHPLRSSLGG